MAVTGFVDLDKVVRNSTAPPGARLILTKPLGIGMITTALKRGEASEDQVRVAVDTMTALNHAASEAMVEAGAEAATDVTGFGLLGHLHFMLSASGVSAEVDAASVPLLPGALDLAVRGLVAGGTRKNHDFLMDHLDWGELSHAGQLTLADAQTSGGLLIAVTEERAAELGRGLSGRGVDWWEIGSTKEGPPGHVAVRGRLRGE
jgi:selenide,water dikinase